MPSDSLHCELTSVDKNIKEYGCVLDSLTCDYFRKASPTLFYFIQSAWAIFVAQITGSVLSEKVYLRNHKRDTHPHRLLVLWYSYL